MIILKSINKSKIQKYKTHTQAILLYILVGGTKLWYDNIMQIFLLMERNFNIKMKILKKNS